MAPSKLVPPSSGSTSVTSVEGASAPSPITTPAAVPPIDFDTDCSRWVVAGVIPGPYTSNTIRPSWSTRKPSV